MDYQRLSHEKVRKAVKIHFKQSRFTGLSIDDECDIQFGTRKGRKYGIADLVLVSLSDAKGHWRGIVECKSEDVGDTEEGRGQLKSYLSATDTRFGILAFTDNPDDWIYCENQRANKFRIINKSDFEEHIFDPPTDDRTDQAVLKRLTRRMKRVTIAFISALLVIAACLSVYFLILLPMHTDTRYEVIRIIDGDTFEIQYKGKLTSIQLIGVNAPEPNTTNNRPPEPYSEEATKYLQEFLLDETVYFDYDQSKFDKNERILAYVYRSSDGVFVNLEIVREGYGEVDRRYPFKYEELFTDYESRAKTDRKGLWRSSFR